LNSREAYASEGNQLEVSEPEGFGNLGGEDMRDLNLTVYVLVIMALVLPRATWAEEKEQKVMKLDEIVVSATKTEKAG
jgi:hypothetical protein